MIRNKKEVTDTEFVVVLLEELLQFVEDKNPHILNCRVEFTGLYPLDRLEIKLDLIHH